MIFGIWLKVQGIEGIVGTKLLLSPPTYLHKQFFSQHFQNTKRWECKTDVEPCLNLATSSKEIWLN